MNTQALFERIDQNCSFSRQRIDIFSRAGLVCYGNFTLCTEEDVSRLPYMTKWAVDELRRHLRRRSLAFREPHQSVAVVIRSQFPSFQRAPVAYISAVRKDLSGSITLPELILMQRAGIRTLGDLHRHIVIHQNAAAEKLAKILRQETDSSGVANKLEDLRQLLIYLER